MGDSGEGGVGWLVFVGVACALVVVLSAVWR